MLIAPLLGELVSGHQALLGFLNPLTFILLALPYGFGAVLCRELSVRWGRGRWNILPLAMAYGLFEEGVVVRSFFNPDWFELGALESFGYGGGIQWWYGLLLIHFHITVSIVSSVLLAELIYPGRRHERWLTDRWLVVCAVGLLLWIPAGILMTSYWPAWPLYVGVWLVIVLLVAAARFLKWEWPASSPTPARSPVWFFLLGMVNMWATFFFGFILPELTSIPFAPFFIGLLALQPVTFVLFLKLSRNGHSLDSRHRFALLAGFLSFFVAYGFFSIAEGEIGRSLVSLATTLALAVLGRRIWRYRNANKEPGVAS